MSDEKVVGHICRVVDGVLIEKKRVEIDTSSKTDCVIVERKDVEVAMPKEHRSIAIIGHHSPSTIGTIMHVFGEDYKIRIADEEEATDLLSEIKLEPIEFTLKKLDVPDLKPYFNEKKGRRKGQRRSRGYSWD